jgi:hypothetical protein
MKYHISLNNALYVPQFLIWISETKEVVIEYSLPIKSIQFFSGD